MSRFPLGRVVNHDPRSLGFPAPRVTTHNPVTHKIFGPVLDQGEIGSCVANASAACLNSAGFHKRLARLVKEPQAVAWYGQMTALDGYPGQYPPDDTGTDINAAGKVLRAAGKIAGWSHTFGIDHLLGSLQVTGVLLGIDWHESMYTPDNTGFVHPDGNIVGGHETFIYADNPDGQYVTVRNSWWENGKPWGLRGDYKLTYVDLDALLHAQGDGAVFIPKAA